MSRLQLSIKRTRKVIAKYICDECSYKAKCHPQRKGVLLAGEKCNTAQPGKDDQSEAHNGSYNTSHIPRYNAQDQSNKCNNKQQCADIDVELDDQTMRPYPAPCISIWKIVRKLNLKI